MKIDQTVKGGPRKNLTGVVPFLGSCEFVYVPETDPVVTPSQRISIQLDNLIRFFCFFKKKFISVRNK